LTYRHCIVVVKLTMSHSMVYNS